ncbi:PF06713 family protein [Bacteriovorax sp. BSW11_IV]|uniref:PH domain-containing protein n=1 Tax=Bacteriovorax sp. BSW11_IV TaxID=1353529 RepID=UPI00038A1F69|nr:PH domain-containing protein [Bacteriovorax sp. BSW11_IV]EQC49170.1 PF06713 family protein [Bacteriovorax sp. BSW11_IV]
MKFKSKIDYSILIVILTPALYFLYEVGKKYVEANTINYGGIITFIIYSALIYTAYLGTSYSIQNDKLIITALFLKSSFSIAEIKEIRKTKTILSAPALSLDRIAITFENYDRLVISPRDLEKFIRMLREINSKIEVSLD